MDILKVKGWWLAALVQLYLLISILFQIQILINLGVLIGFLFFITEIGYFLIIAIEDEEDLTKVIENYKMFQKRPEYYGVMFIIDSIIIIGSAAFGNWILCMFWLFGTLLQKHNHDYIKENLV